MKLKPNRPNIFINKIVSIYFYTRSLYRKNNLNYTLDSRSSSFVEQYLELWQEFLIFIGDNCFHVALQWLAYRRFVNNLRKDCVRFYCGTIFEQYVYFAFIIPPWWTIVYFLSKNMKLIINLSLFLKFNLHKNRFTIDNWSWYIKWKAIELMNNILIKLVVRTLVFYSCIK